VPETLHEQQRPTSSRWGAAVGVPGGLLLRCRLRNRPDAGFAGQRRSVLAAVLSEYAVVDHEHGQRLAARLAPT